MSVGRDYKKSNWKNNSKNQVRKRALLVTTLILVGGFASVLAYIKTQRPPSSTGSVTPQSTQQSPKKASSGKVKSTTDQTSKPQYEYYKELKQREVVIRKDELDPEKLRKRKEPPPPETKKKQEITKKKSTDAKKTAKQAKKPASTSSPKKTTTSSKSTSSGKQRGYLIQAGAFSKQTDAEKVKAKLAMLGIRARVEKGSTGGNKVIHRVRIGPVNSNAKMQSMRKQLSSNNIQSIAIPLK